MKFNMNKTPFILIKNVAPGKYPFSFAVKMRETECIHILLCDSYLSRSHCLIKLGTCYISIQCSKAVS